MTVTSDLEAKEGIVNVKLDVSTSENEDIKQHVYKLTVNPKHKVIEVYINGESITFDNISAL